MLLALLHSQAVIGTIRPEKDCNAYCEDTGNGEGSVKNSRQVWHLPAAQPVATTHGSWKSPARSLLLCDPKRPGTGDSHLS